MGGAGGGTKAAIKATRVTVGACALVLLSLKAMRVMVQSAAAHVGCAPPTPLDLLPPAVLAAIAGAKPPPWRQLRDSAAALRLMPSPSGAARLALSAPKAAPLMVAAQRKGNGGAADLTLDHGSVAGIGCMLAAAEA